jgi:hypothetical protein
MATIAFGIEKAEYSNFLSPVRFYLDMHAEGLGEGKPTGGRTENEKAR